MSNSKPVPPFTFDVLCYLNRDQLERFSIVCRPLKNLIGRYFHSKPYRVFDYLHIRGGSYGLFHNFYVQWHPNRDDYSVQQFLAGQRYAGQRYVSLWKSYYSFAEMRPYLGPTVRIKEKTIIYVGGDSTYNPGHITEMESMSYLWRNDEIHIWNANNHGRRICAEDFQLILNSPTILQCRILDIRNAYFSLKDYKVLYAVKIIAAFYKKEKVDPNYWLQFIEQPGAKPVVILCGLQRESIDNALEQLSKDFSSAVLPNAFKIVFGQCNDPLSEFREMNKTSGEKLQLLKGPPAEYQEEILEEEEEYKCYTLERSSI